MIQHKSLATIKPLEIIDFEIEEDARDWKQQWQDYYDQYDLFNLDDTGESKLRDKLLKSSI